jgi:formylglycine-generating enzyme required for sulfatase activity
MAFSPGTLHSTSRVFLIVASLAALVVLPVSVRVEAQREDLAVAAKEIKQRPAEAVPKAPMKAANTKVSGAGGLRALPMRAFQFEVVTVDSSGAITSRRKGQSRSCNEQVNGIDLEMVEIRGGNFLMGNSEAESDRVKKEYEGSGAKPENVTRYSGWEVPQHSVSVPSFFIGKYEVTQAQWRAVYRLPKVNRDLLSDPSHFKGDRLPVETVSWEDAVEFCARLSRATGRTYRLPTEAEWEYACRGGTTTPFYLGETITTELVNYDGDHPYGSAPKGTIRRNTVPVGSIGYPNSFGLYDMSGNVWEWCMDYWHESYNGAPTDGSSWESAGEASQRVMRGGSWFNVAALARSANRFYMPPGSRRAFIGFRLVTLVRTQ